MEAERSWLDENLVDSVAYAIWRESVIQDDPYKKPPEEEWNLLGMPPYTRAVAKWASTYLVQPDGKNAGKPWAFTAWEWIAESRKERWRAIARAAIAATLEQHHTSTTSPRKDA